MNKQFTVRHEEIKESEINKRFALSERFDSHLSAIMESLDDERERLKCINKDNPDIVYENEIVKENASLQDNYDKLLVEIAEKSAMIDEQLSKKETVTVDL